MRELSVVVRRTAFSATRRLALAHVAIASRSGSESSRGSAEPNLSRATCSLGKVEVRREHLSAEEFHEERVAAPSRRSLPVVDVLIRSHVVAQTGAARGLGLQGVDWI